MTKRPPLLMNGVPVVEIPYRAAVANRKPPPVPRIFDHLAGNEPEDARFCAVAKAMRKSSWWLSWVGRPEDLTQPKPVKGTIKPRLLPKHVEEMSDEEFDRLARDVHARSNKRKTA